MLQAWDFRPGSNFVLEMQWAATEAERTIAVLSQAYLDALYTQPEWAAAFGRDPMGERGTLLPVRVRECDIEGLLPQIVYIDVVGLDEAAAKDALLAGVRRERAKPTTPPGFPGAVPRSVSERPGFPGTRQLHATRAEVIAELHKRLVRAENSIRYMLETAHDPERIVGEQRKEQVVNSAAENTREFWTYFNEHRIYFDSDLCDKLDRVRAGFEMVFVWHRTSRGPDDVSTWIKMWDTMYQRIPEIREDVENTFRKMLGVDQTNDAQ